MSQLAEPLWTDPSLKGWHWCAQADLQLGKKKERKPRQEVNCQPFLQRLCTWGKSQHYLGQEDTLTFSYWVGGGGRGEADVNIQPTVSQLQQLRNYWTLQNQVHLWQASSTLTETSFKIRETNNCVMNKFASQQCAFQISDYSLNTCTK